MKSHKDSLHSNDSKILLLENNVDHIRDTLVEVKQAILDIKSEIKDMKNEFKKEIHDCTNELKSAIKIISDRQWIVSTFLIKSMGAGLIGLVLWLVNTHFHWFKMGV